MSSSVSALHWPWSAGRASSFLDEPTTGVDPEGRVGIRHVVAGLRDEGACVLITTHELTEAERLADRMVVLHSGRVLARGTPAELAAGVAPSVRFTSSPGLEVAQLGRRLGVTVTEGEPGSYRVGVAASPALTAELARWLAERDAPLVDLRTGASLEETYLALVGSEAAPGSEEPPARRRGRRR